MKREYTILRKWAEPNRDVTHYRIEVVEPLPGVGKMVVTVSRSGQELAADGEDAAIQNGLDYLLGGLI